MALSGKYALQRIFTVKLFDLATGECLAYLSDLKQSTFAQDGTIVYAQGGAGNPKIIGFDHSKVATLTTQNAVFDLGAMGIQVGATPVVGTNTSLVITDTMTAGTDSAVTTYTALGTAGSQIKYVYVLNSDGSLGTKFTQDGSVGAGKFTYTAGTKTIAFNTGEVASGTKLIAFYNATAGASSKTITSNASVFAKNVKVVADGLFRDTCSGVDMAGQLVLNKAKASNKFQFALTANGEPAVQDLELEALRSCGSDELFHIIIMDSSETV